VKVEATTNYGRTALHIAAVQQGAFYRLKGFKEGALAVRKPTRSVRVSAALSFASSGCVADSATLWLTSASVLSVGG